MLGDLRSGTTCFVELPEALLQREQGTNGNWGSISSRLRRLFQDVLMDMSRRKFWKWNRAEERFCRMKETEVCAQRGGSQTTEKCKGLRGVTGEMC